MLASFKWQSNRVKSAGGERGEAEVEEAGGVDKLMGGGGAAVEHGAKEGVAVPGGPAHVAAAGGGGVAGLDAEGAFVVFVGVGL